KEALQYLRSKRTSDGREGISAPSPGAPDPYLAGINSPEEFNELVKNERRIITCFEGLRFFDLSRWTTDLSELNQAVKGARITRSGDGTFTYDFNYQVEERRFSSAFLPIPYSEILKMDNLIQNEGWEGWQ